jgi:hypothetical protein
MLYYLLVLKAESVLFYRLRLTVSHDWFFSYIMKANHAKQKWMI